MVQHYWGTISNSFELAPFMSLESRNHPGTIPGLLVWGLRVFMTLHSATSASGLPAGGFNSKNEQPGRKYLYQLSV